MTTGLLLVDPQYDFFPGGALAVANGDQIVAPLNEWIQRHPDAPIFASRDWHPPHTRHFKARGGIWPPHCVSGTRGASFHDELQMQRAVVYDKGTDPEDDGGYSAFDGARVDDGGVRHTLVGDLRAAGITTLVVGGLATDYCVKATVLDALRQGFSVRLLRPAVRAVELAPGDGARALHEMVAAGAIVVDDAASP
jgi:nicotinamidase/pyrazinamidase